MEITLNALLLGKPTCIKDKDYLSTKDYVSDFINQMKKFNAQFIYHVQPPNQVTITNGNLDLTYNKVWIQAIVPGPRVGIYDEVYGLVYALDVKTPVYKVYRAWINSKNQNMCVTNPEWLIVKEIEPGKKFEIDIKTLMQMPSDFEEKLEFMSHNFISSEEKDNHEFLGQLIDKSLLYEYKTAGGKVKLSSTEVIKAFESIYHDTSSKY